MIIDRMGNAFLQRAVYLRQMLNVLFHIRILPIHGISSPALRSVHHHASDEMYSPRISRLEVLGLSAVKVIAGPLPTHSIEVATRYSENLSVNSGAPPLHSGAANYRTNAISFFSETIFPIFDNVAWSSLRPHRIISVAEAVRAWRKPMNLVERATRCRDRLQRSGVRRGRERHPAVIKRLLAVLVPQEHCEDDDRCGASQCNDFDIHCPASFPRLR